MRVHAPSPLLDVALDLCANLAASDRYEHVIDAVRRLIPCDSAALLALRDGVLVPVATAGLVPEARERRFVPDAHPRLARILAADGPVRFRDASLPDPFDGLLATFEISDRVHACMGTRLVVADAVVGLLAVDARDRRAFDDVDDSVVALLGALAGAALRTAGLIDALERTSARRGAIADQLRAEVREARGGEIIGRSPAIEALLDEIALVAPSDMSVLIAGETGVGKELVARAIHARSRRAAQPIVHVNCAALPESIAESELFGHVRGAFTSAHAARAGKFEAADGGTLLLDEVGELPGVIQPKLLRALQSGEIQRVGHDRPIRVDVRIIAATNRDLPAAVRAGRFRADLYHRLSVYPLRVPPLRERLDDVPLLAGVFLDRAKLQLGLGTARLSDAARAALRAYGWPGNVRELEHVIMRATLRAHAERRGDTALIGPRHLALEPLTASSAPEASPTGAPGLDAVDAAGGLAAATDAFRRAVITRAVDASDGNWAEAARGLGMNRSNFHRLARRLGLR